MCALTGEPCGCTYHIKQIMLPQVSASMIPSLYALKRIHRSTGVNIDETISMQAPGKSYSLVPLYCMTAYNTIECYLSEACTVSQINTPYTNFTCVVATCKLQ